MIYPIKFDWPSVQIEHLTAYFTGFEPDAQGNVLCQPGIFDEKSIQIRRFRTPLPHLQRGKMQRSAFKFTRGKFFAPVEKARGNIFRPADESDRKPVAALRLFL